ncbi:hypothetical protein OZD61_01250 [Wolbachia endosymbiont of Drosophila bocki]|nr:hypothetical protein [Wolbachia endosymbiont of Drosophila bocki]
MSFPSFLSYYEDFKQVLRKILPPASINNQRFSIFIYPLFYYLS